MAANGRNGPVVSDSSGFERKLVRWCRIRPVVSDWSVGFSVGFSRWEPRGFISEARRNRYAALHWKHDSVWQPILRGCRNQHIW